MQRNNVVGKLQGKIRYYQKRVFPFLISFKKLLDYTKWLYYAWYINCEVIDV